MKAISALLALTLTAFAETTTLPAGLPAESKPEALKEAGFTSLFNGENLDGWRKTGGNAEYEVKNGAVRGFGENIKGNTFLRTEDEFGDFIFTFQFKFLDKSGNSGCMFRAFQKGGKPDGRVAGYQCEHDNWKEKQRSWTAGIFDEARRGWLYPHKDADQAKKDQFTGQGSRLFNWDGWNTIVIKCEGNHLQTWLNGELRADFTDTSDEHTDLKGFIALQVHGGKSGDILWRNLYLKEL
ncbi:MAG: DUF1080 domain-containing protein [Verrucomicrobiota bacterium JB023]|nr:DUF1080 domain-containing protein [Verrucomicrobiota bacterium JB023]